MASRSRFRPRIAFLVVVLMAAMTLTGCLDLQTPVDRAVTAIDRATTEIQAESQDWQFVLESSINDLDKDARDLIEGPVRQLIDRSVGAAQTGIACIIDLIGERVVDGLAQIRAHLTGAPYKTPPPSLCLLSPSDISLGQPPSDRQKVEMFGYGFDARRPLTVQHVTKAGAVDVSKVFSVQTPYHASLAVDQVPIGPDSLSLTIAGANRGAVFTLPVFQAPPRTCEHKQVAVAPETVTLPARLVRGDPEFFGNGPTMTATFSDQNTGSAITGRLTLSAQETIQNPFGKVGTYWNGDTYADGDLSWPVYQAPDGWSVVSFTPGPGSDSYTARDNSTASDGRPSSGTTVLKTWRVVGDINGVDVGVPEGTSVTAVFSTVQVVIAERPSPGGCS